MARLPRRERAMTAADDGKPCSLTRFLIEEQRALADRDRDPLAGARDHLDQQPQVGADAAGALLLDEVARERNGFIAAACVGHGHEG